MPRTKSALKALRRAEKRRIRNRAVRSTVRTFIKKALESIEKGNPDEARENVRIACRYLDKAVSKGVLHPNTAARRKSKLMQKLNGLLKAS